jgi:hypothetical protein
MAALSTYLVTAVLVATMVVHLGARAAALTVRLYNTAGIPAHDLAAARQAAESILRDAGLTVSVRHCRQQSSPGAAVTPCDGPLTLSEVVVRVIKAPALTTSVDADAYGFAYVVQETDRGWLATVFADRIARAATRTRVNTGILLGRVMAHEVGHLLLGSRYHGDVGLMRGAWPDALLSGTGDEWRFSVLESARIQRLLASMLRTSLTPPAAVHSSSDKFDPS